MQASAKDVIGTAQDAYENATGLNAPKSINNFHDAAEGIRDAYNDTYDKLRQATQLPEGGNAFDIARNKVSAAKKVLFNPSSVDASADAQDVIDHNPVTALFAPDGPAAQAGISPVDLKAAGDAWKKAATLDDLHDIIDKGFTENAGVRSLGPSSTDARTAVRAQLDPKKFVTQANTAINKIPKADLQNAMGEKGFNDLNDLRSEMALNINKSGYQTKVAKLLKAKVGPMQQLVGIGGSAGLGLVAHLFGASNPLTAGIGLSAEALHFLYSHPDIGAPIAKVAAKMTAPVVTQAARQWGSQFGGTPAQ
ncbi:MAG: hypothetical protein WBM24_13565 [Candidatus Sulfotelmatobacter sp.]